MIKLIDPKGEEIKEPLDINKEVNNFYSNLYKAKDLEECEIALLTGNGNSKTIWGGIKIIRRENNNRRGRNSVEKYETWKKPWYGWFWGRIFQVLLEAAWTICS